MPFIPKIFPSIFIDGPQNDYLAHTITCLPSGSNCIRRTLYPAVLGQVDEDGGKVLLEEEMVKRIGKGEKEKKVGMRGRR